MSGVYLDANGYGPTPDVVFERDSTGVELSRRFVNGLEVSWQLNELGLPIRRRVAVGRPGEYPQDVGAVDISWDSDSRLTAWIDAQAGPQFIDRDARGRVVREHDAADLVIDRPLDATGNVLGRFASSYGPGGRVQARDGVTFEHDLDGRVIRKVEPDGSTWAFYWTGAGLLRRVDCPDGKSVEYEYDVLARRTRRHITSADPGSAREGELDTRYFWDGHVPVHEIDTVLGLTTWRWQPGTFNLLAKECKGRRLTVVLDHLGAPTEMYDDAGRLAWKMRLYIDGTSRMLHGRGADLPFRRLGEYDDADTGLSYNRFRYYDPAAGAYLSKDPAGLAGGLNAYAHLEDPFRAVDPLGLNPSVIALGLQNAPDTYTVPGGPSFPVVVTDALDNFAKHPDVNGATWQRFDNVGDDIGGAIRQAMEDADRIHFNLQGMDNVAEILANPDPLRFSPPSTNWELATVLSDEGLLAKAKFWERPGEPSTRIPCGP